MCNAGYKERQQNITVIVVLSVLVLIITSFYQCHDLMSIIFVYLQKNHFVC